MTFKKKFLAQSMALVVLLFTASGMVWAMAPMQDQPDLVDKARTLARQGKEYRGEALKLLEDRLAERPTDGDARTLYGVVLSWEGRYDESREQLSRVLAKNPDHSDALPALINVELWSDHPERAEQLAREALLRHPDDTQLMYVQARALRNMHQDREAIQTIDRLLAYDPNNKDARTMRRSLEQVERVWEVSVDHSYDFFSDGRDGQHLTAFQVRRGTSAGSVIGRFSIANRFGKTSYQEEMDYYPSFRPGTYGYLNVGISDAILFPRYRVGADLFQTLPKSFEGSVGYRHLGFSDGVNIWTFALAKYYSNWLFTGREFLTPSDIGVSKTTLLSARRFLGNEGFHDYIQFKYSRGASPALARTNLNIESLDSQRFSVDFDKVFRNRWAAAFSTGVAQEQQVNSTPSLRRYNLEGTLYYRF